MYSHFFGDYDPTIEDSYRKRLLLDDEVLVLDILDLAGAEEYNAMRDAYVRTGDGFLIVYAINQRNSFEQLQTYKDWATKVKDRDKVPIVLCGNKSDLEEDRQVSKEEGQALAKLWGCPFVETSALNRINVDEAFLELVKECIKEKKEREVEKPSNCFLM